MSSSSIDPKVVSEALRQTPRGQLVYDRNCFPGKNTLEDILQDVEIEIENQKKSFLSNIAASQIRSITQETEKGQNTQKENYNTDKNVFEDDKGEKRHFCNSSQFLFEDKENKILINQIRHSYQVQRETQMFKRRFLFEENFKKYRESWKDNLNTSLEFLRSQEKIQESINEEKSRVLLEDSIFKREIYVQEIKEIHESVSQIIITIKNELMTSEPEIRKEFESKINNWESKIEEDFEFEWKKENIETFHKDLCNFFQEVKRKNSTRRHRESIVPNSPTIENKEEIKVKEIQQTYFPPSLISIKAPLSESTLVPLSISTPESNREDSSEILGNSTRRLLIEELSTFKNNWKSSIDILETSEKTFIFDCTKAILIPINAISDVSKTHLKNKLEKLTGFLKGENVIIGGGDDKKTVNCLIHPLGQRYSLHALARKFISQGEEVVSTKPDFCFSLSLIMNSLSVSFPDFGQLVLAYFYELCPYLIPLPLPQDSTDSNFFIKAGYHFDSEGKIETQTHFLKRMGGLARLYAAYSIGYLPTFQAHLSVFHGIGHVWTLLTSIMNHPPIKDISATILCELLDVSALTLSKVYKSQFSKLLSVLKDDYLPHIRSITLQEYSGPYCRLENLLSRKIREPKGILPQDFI